MRMHDADRSGTLAYAEFEQLIDQVRRLVRLVILLAVETRSFADIVTCMAGVF